MAPYIFRIDRQYVTQSFWHARRRLKSRYLHLPVKLLCGAGLLVLIGLFAYIQAYLPTALMILFLALLASAHLFDPLWIHWLARKDPSYGLELSVTLSDESVRFSTAHYDSTVKWGAFSEAAIFEDGILLYTSPRMCYWLPDTGLGAEAVQRAKSLVKVHAPNVFVSKKAVV